MLKLISSILLCAIALTAADQSSCLVKTSKGKLQGVQLNSQNGTVINGFFGVPYAQPPVNKLRWKYGVETEPWNRTLDATKMKARCSQPPSLNDRGQEYLMSEDCLYMNIYSPKLPSDKQGDLLPVLFMLHGGGYISGGADMYPAKGVVNNLANRDVVVVTPNYRLGAFGFLTTGDENLPGNFGLMDMMMALRWVSEEIAVFGGDPKRVTLYGVSTGAHAASILLMYPNVEDTVHQAILQSGSALLPASTNISLAVNTSNRFLEQLGCGSPEQTDIDKIMECAATKDAAEIVSASIDEKQYWRPAALESFLQEQLSQRAPMNMMIGVNRHEHSLYLASEKRRQQLLNPTTLSGGVTFDYNQFTRQDLHESIARALDMYGIAEDSMSARVAYLIYDDDYTGDDKMHWYNQYVKLESDSSFFAPAYREAVSMSKSSDVYLYSFDHLSVNDRCLSQWRGVQHADDQQYLMAHPGRMGPFRFIANNYDYAVSDCFGEMIANFVKIGDPSSTACNAVWSPLNVKKVKEGGIKAQYQSLGFTSLRKSDFHPRATEFWSELVYMLGDMRPVEL